MHCVTFTNFGSFLEVAVDTANAPWDIEILSIDGATLPWTIPDFPVVTINFKKVTFKQGDKNATGLVNGAETIAPTKYTCTKHCTIKLHDKEEYTVLWALKPTAQTLKKSLNAHAENTKPVGSTKEYSNQEKHTLPFKVLGTCLSKERRTSLEMAYEYMENNRHVFIDLVPEPENTHDPNAIAVCILSQDEFEKVGYIPRELTSFIHPLIHTGDMEVCKEYSLQNKLSACWILSYDKHYKNRTLGQCCCCSKQKCQIELIL